MNSRDKTKQLAKNTLIFLIGNIGSKFIQFFLVPLYTYTMTTEEFGTTEIVLTASNVLIPLFSISIADGLLRFGLDKNNNSSSVLKTSLLITCFGTFATIVFIPVFRLYEPLRNWLAYFLVILNLQMYRGVLSINIKIKNKNKTYAIDSILYTFVLCITNVLMLAILHRGITGYFMSYIVANVFSIIFLIISGSAISDVSFGKISFNLFKALIVYSLPMIANAISWWIINASDKLMIEHFMNNSDVGIYSVAAKIPSLVTTFTGVFSQAWTISAVIEYDSERDKNFYSNTYRRYYSVLFIAIGAAITIIRPFMQVYVSEEFRLSWLYAPLLIASAAYSGITSFYGSIYAATKKNVNAMMTIVFGAVLNIALNALLISRIGVMGAVIATYVSWLLVAIIRMIDVKKFFPYDVNIMEFMLLSLINILQCLSVLLLPMAIGTMIAAMLLGIIVVVEKDIVHSIIEMILKKFRRLRF